MSESRRKEPYTASEAIKRLGVTKMKFYEYVESGLVKKTIERRGGKQGRYNPDDVDALALALDMAAEAQKQPQIVFSRSTAGDQLQEMNIGIRCFGSEFITPLPERIEFQKKSDFTFWSLKVRDTVVAYTSMFRFPPDFLEDLLTGNRIEREITTKVILPFVRDEDFDIYIDVMATDPLLPLNKRTYYSGIMISRFANVLLDLLANRYQIRNIYTVTATPEGDNLVRELGFRLLEGKSKKLGRIAYVFPLDEQGKERLKNIAKINRRSLR
jgi:hypothetical protein